jgi:N-acetylmuramoyl-L-alanine amidase
VKGLPSPNFGERRAGAVPTLIVLHYTAMVSTSVARARLCSTEHEVSAHWLISEAGEAEQLVDEAHRAWHAGAGEWRGLQDINSQSIGIELANSGFHPFPEPQMAALERLLAQIMARWQIGPAGVIGHSDMAPGRKSDPGARFDWRRLALGGFAIWPANVGDAARPLAESLAQIGYPNAPEPVLLDAFRLRFAPWAKGPETAQDRALADGVAGAVAAADPAA